MKKIILLMFLIFSILTYSKTIAEFIEINRETNINFDEISKILENKFGNFTFVKRQISYNSKLTFNIFKNPNIADYGIYIKINNIKKEEKITKNVLFIRNDNSGTYVYFKNIYVPITSKKRYDYDGKNYFLSKNGKYIYLDNYLWAKNEEDKFIEFSGYYKKELKTIKTYKYSLNGIYELVDFKTSFVVSSGSLNTSSSNKETLIKSSLNKINFNFKKFYNEKPKIALYISKNGYESIENKLYDYIRTNFENDGRYAVLDRNNLDKLFEEKKLDMITKNTNKVASNFKNVEYIILLQVNMYKKEKYSTYNEYNFLNNVYGEYSNNYKLDVGTYYNEVKNKDKITYTPSATGIYVKTIKTPWDRKPKYLNIKNFYTKIGNVDLKEDIILNYTYRIIDLKTATLLGEKTNSINKDLYLSKPTNFYGGIESDIESTAINSIVYNISKDMSYNIMTIFPIRTTVNKVINNEVFINSGLNYGVLPFSIYRIIDKYKTIGQVRVVLPMLKESKTKIISLKDKNSIPKSGDLAYEDFYFIKPLGFSIGINSCGLENFGFEFKYRFFNIYNETKSFISFINSYNIQNITDEFNEIYKKYETNFNLSLGFNLFSTNYLNVFAGGGIIYFLDKSSLNIYPMLEINSLKKDKNFSIYFRVSYTNNTIEELVGFETDF
ncbi:hypothetical protein OSSY52_04710 [Tepiditoga spiralis]|uniref:Uncharacterized protein n=1 Tax=Tepiditoga spiralis TaxID=2108365 RepID=A0A7G1G202_9BACT|nr:hypothetical protein [Tepiditoga spiralis]BBE30330.1 hypothetical protein OSSY52_04710 [Tepiditoga spiralis]